eukprot:4690741-Pyramimonas_sp.AAC.1
MHVGVIAPGGREMDSNRPETFPANKKSNAQHRGLTAWNCIFEILFRNLGDTAMPTPWCDEPPERNMQSPLPVSTTSSLSCRHVSVMNKISYIKLESSL